MDYYSPRIYFIAASGPRLSASVIARQPTGRGMPEPPAWCTVGTLRIHRAHSRKPVATTVIERTEPIASSTCAPKMMFASGCDIS